MSGLMLNVFTCFLKFNLCATVSLLSVNNNSSYNWYIRKGGGNKILTLKITYTSKMTSLKFFSKNVLKNRARSVFLRLIRNELHSNTGSFNVALRPGKCDYGDTQILFENSLKIKCYTLEIKSYSYKTNDVKTDLLFFICGEIQNIFNATIQRGRGIHLSFLIYNHQLSIIVIIRFYILFWTSD